jgi:hypothetical protein
MEPNLTPYRLRLVAEDEIPEDLWEQMGLTQRHLQIFLSVENPAEWPVEMQPLADWLDEHLEWSL